jgi:uncharacterized protein with PIN domain
MRTEIIIQQTGATHRTKEDITDSRWQSEHRQCKGKIKNATRAQAEAQVERLIRLHHSYTHVYKCEICGAWHVGHTAAERQKTMIAQARAAGRR